MKDKILMNKLYVAHNTSNRFPFASFWLTKIDGWRAHASKVKLHSNNKPKTHTKDIIYAFKCNNNIGRNGNKNETECVYGCERCATHKHKRDHFHMEIHILCSFFLLLLLLLHIVSFDFYVYLRGKNHCNNNKMIIIHSTAQQLNPVMLTDRVKTMCAESCRREVGFVCLCVDWRIRRQPKTRLYVFTLDEIQFRRMKLHLW